MHIFEKAQSLGLDIASQQLDPPEAPFFHPGIQWWPRDDGELSHADFSGIDHAALAMPHDFTFDQQQLSNDFVQGVHYPILDFSSVFPGPHTQQHHPAQS